MTKVLDFARSTMTFRIDIDKIPPRTLSHRPPYPMNNARVVLDCRCRITERVTGRTHTIVMGASCKTERVGADVDLWLMPNGDFIPLFSDDAFMHIKTFARAGMGSLLESAGGGEQPDRLEVPIEGTFERVHLDLVEREGKRLADASAIVEAVLANDRLVGIHRFETDRYQVEIEYPVKTINANEREWVYQTDTGPIMFPELDCEPDQLLSRVELAFTAANNPDWADFIVRTRTPIADVVDVHHYSKAVRLDGIANEFYRLPEDGAVDAYRVELPARAGDRRDGMKITGIESRVIGYDIAEAWGEGVLPEGIHSTWYEYSFDTFETDEGVVGYTMQNANIRDGAAMTDVLHDLYAPQVIGEDPLESEALWTKLRRLNRHAYNLSDSVAGAIDVAVWDIRGKVAGLPIATMLGLAREKIPAYATARNVEPTPEDVFKEAQDRKAQGYHAFKIQFWDGLDRDIPRFRAAREAVGDDYPLMQDAAGMYSYAQAIEAGKVLGDLGYQWFEEPIPDRNLFQLKRLTDQLAVPILAGETSRVHELAEGMRMGAFDIARGDVLMKEGITGLRKAVGMAELLGYDLEVHGINQPLLDVANLHVALSMPNCRWSETFNPIYYRGLKGGPLDIDAEGYKHLPPGPGLGVELDWDWIDDNTKRIVRTPAK